MSNISVYLWPTLNYGIKYKFRPQSKNTLICYRAKVMQLVGAVN